LRSLVIAILVCSSITAQAASASDAEKQYKRFHYAVYLPVHLIGLILTGPIVIVTSVVQHHDDKLKAEAFRAHQPEANPL